MKDAPLKVTVADGQLTISIGVSTLAYALKHGDEPLLQEVEFTDEEGFARDVAHVLEDEDEEGTTRVHRLLDEAADEAINQGSQHCQLRDE